MLEPNVTRSEGGTRLTLPAGTTSVRLQLVVPNPAAHQSYRVSVGTAERPAVWQGPASPADSSLVTDVPAAVLSPGDYTLELEGDGEALATYSFRITTK